MKYFTQWDDSLPTGTSTQDDPPVEWTKRFDAAGGGATNFTRYVIMSGGNGVLSAIKRRIVRTAQFAAGRGVISWDRIDGDSDRANGELLAIYSVGTNRETRAYLVARGSTGATTAYYAGLEPSGDAIRIGKVVAGVETSLATAALSLPEDGLFYVRFRFQTLPGSPTGTLLELTVWDVSDAEPAAPNLTITDSSITTAGFYGLWNEGNATQGNWNFCACATGTATVPRPITDDEYAAWERAQDVPRCVAAIIYASGFSGSTGDFTKDVPFYISDAGYNSHEQDTPSNRHFKAVIDSVPSIRHEIGIALRGRVTLGAGSLVISNPQTAIGDGGIRDRWLRTKWRKSIVILLEGAPDWPLHDFRPFFVGRLKPPTAQDAQKITFPLGEIAEIFNVPIQENVFASGAGLNFADEYKPLLIGRASYVEPPLYDSTNRKYKIHDGAIDDPLPTWVHTDGPIALDGGGSLSSTAAHTVTVSDTIQDRITVSPAHGVLADAVSVFTGGTPPTPFALNTKYYVIPVSGTIVQLALTKGGAAVNITSSTAGATIYFHNFDIDAAGGDIVPVTDASARLVVATVDQAGNFVNPANMIKWAVFTKFGLSPNHFDAPSFDALGLLLTSGYEAGFWVGRKRMTVEEVVNQISLGTNAWYGFSPDGLMQVGRLDLPSDDAELVLTEGDIAEGSLRQTGTVLPFDFTETRLRYRPVFLTGGPYFVAGVEAESLLEPIYVYPSPGTPDTPGEGDAQPKTEFDTLYLDGTNELARLAEMFSKSMGTFEFRTHRGAARLRIGATIQLTHERKGWKLYSAADPPSPDNPSAFDARKAVVLGKELSRSGRDPFTITLTVVRQLPQYAPSYAEDMPPFLGGPPYDLSLGTIVAEGGAIPTYTRATAAWEFDHEDVLHQLKNGEAPFCGWRREENLIATTSENLSNAAWTKTNVTVGGDGKTVTATSNNGEVTQDYAIPATKAAGDYRPRFRVKRVSGTGTIWINLDGSLTALTLTTEAQDFAGPLLSGQTGTLTVGVRLATSGDVVTVEHAGLYDVSGRANQVAPEYVSVGVESSPYHGVNVDGVKVFNYEHANALGLGGLLTEAQGPAISRAILKHLHIEPYATTNRITAPRNATDAAWTKTNVTAARDVVGMDNRTNAASRLTGTAGNGTCVQALAALGAPADCRFAVYLKRISGSGTIEIEIQAGTWVAAPTLSSTEWTRVATGVSGVTARTVGVRIVTNGDVVAMDFGLEETRSTGNSSPIDTAVAATRNAAVMVFSGAALIDKAKGVIYAEFAPDQDGTAAQTMYPIATEAANAVRIDAGATVVGYLNGAHGASPAVTYVRGQPIKAVHTWDANRSDVYVNGVRGTTGDGSALSGMNTDLYIGSTAAGAGTGIYIARLGVMALPLNHDQAKDLST